MKLWITAAALLLALTACGGGSSDDADEAAPTPTKTSSGPSESPTAEQESPEAALEEAYRAYIAAFLTGDGAAAYGLLSERCQDKEPLSSFAEASEAAAELYGKVDYTIESVTVNGDEGTVDATYAVEALNSGGGSLWVLEDGEWRSDKCD